MSHTLLLDVAVMPDVHYGKGATVGSVIAMRQALAPAAVGAAIPVGFHAHDDPVDPRRVHGLATAGWDAFWSGFGALTAGVGQLAARPTRQMGTLGGGNHFIELCVEQGGPPAGRVWLMLHSGSRNIGKELAERHIAVARCLPHNADLPDRDLPVFVAGTPEMAAYRRAYKDVDGVIARQADLVEVVAHVKQVLCVKG